MHKTVWIITNCGKFLEMGIPDKLTCLLRNLMQVKKQESQTWNDKLVENLERST